MKAEITAATLVLLGRFRPSDFTIEQLIRGKVLSKDELSAAQYEILLPDQAVTVVLPWGKVFAVEERLMVEVSQPPFIRGCDFALKTLNDIAATSTVFKFGINLVSHYRFESIGARDNFARRFAPLEPWGDFGAVVEKSFKEDGARHGGVMRVTMRQAVPSDRSAGWLDVTIEPSPAIENHLGVAISTNDHYELGPEEVKDSRGTPRAVSEQMLNLLSSSFESSIERSFQICESLTSQKQ